MAPQRRYAVNDKVLCSHGQFWYLAKIIDVHDADSDDPLYTIHYQGWKKTHDEKIRLSESGDRFKEYSEEALKEAQDQQRAVSTQATAKKRSRKSEVRKSEGSRGSTPETANSSRASVNSDKMKPAAKKRKLDASASPPKPTLTHTPIVPTTTSEPTEIDLPVSLRKILIDDNDAISRQYKVHKLPTRFTVQDILNDYSAEFEKRGIKKDEDEETQSSTGQEGSNSTDQVLIIYANGSITSSAYKFILGAEGIRDYFNTLLPYQLLYKFERPQYNEFKTPEVKGRKSQDAKPRPPSEIYGLVHLLRLFSRLSSVLKLTPWDSKVRSIINEVCRDFLVFLDTNKDKYIDVNKDYVPTSSEYQKKVEELYNMET